MTRANAREIIKMMFPEYVVGVQVLPCIVKIAMHQTVASPSVSLFCLSVILLATLFVMAVMMQKIIPVTMTHKINLLPKGIKNISLNSVDC